MKLSSEKKVICYYILVGCILNNSCREKSLHPYYLRGVDFDGVGAENVVVDGVVVADVGVGAGRSGVNSVEWVSNHF